MLFDAVANGIAYLLVLKFGIHTSGFTICKIMSSKNIVLLFSFRSGCLLFLFIAQFSWPELQHSFSRWKAWAQKCSPPSLRWRPCQEGSVNREGLRETDRNMVPPTHLPMMTFQNILQQKHTDIFLSKLSMEVLVHRLAKVFYS